jgi:ketosteroid isomerase-like protein
MTNLAAQFFDHLNSGDAAAALDLTTDDFTWKVTGKPGGPFHLAGTYSKDEFLDMLGSVGGILRDGPKMEITSVTDGGSTIVIEAHVTGESMSGALYDNDLVYAFDVRDGRLAAAREYLDTAHAADVFSTAAQ